MPLFLGLKLSSLKYTWNTLGYKDQDAISYNNKTESYLSKQSHRNYFIW